MPRCNRGCWTVPVRPSVSAPSPSGTSLLHRRWDCWGVEEWDKHPPVTVVTHMCVSVCLCIYMRVCQCCCVYVYQCCYVCVSVVICECCLCTWVCVCQCCYRGVSWWLRVPVLYVSVVCVCVMCAHVCCYVGPCCYASVCHVCVCQCCYVCMSMLLPVFVSMSCVFVSVVFLSAVSPNWST